MLLHIDICVGRLTATACQVDCCDSYIIGLRADLDCKVYCQALCFIPLVNQTHSMADVNVCATMYACTAVLDDNRMLCLPNSERIKLDESCLRMMFEVEDLQYASPATVSRYEGEASSETYSFVNAQDSVGAPLFQMHVEGKEAL